MNKEANERTIDLSSTNRKNTRCHSLWLKLCWQTWIFLMRRGNKSDVFVFFSPKFSMVFWGWKFGMNMSILSRVLLVVVVVVAGGGGEGGEDTHDILLMEKSCTTYDARKGLDTAIKNAFRASYVVQDFFHQPYEHLEGPLLARFGEFGPLKRAIFSG